MMWAGKRSGHPTDGSAASSPPPSPGFSEHHKAPSRSRLGSLLWGPKWCSADAPNTAKPNHGPSTPSSATRRHLTASGCEEGSVATENTSPHQAQLDSLARACPGLSPRLAPELRALRSLVVDEISAWGWNSREASRETHPRSALRAPELRWHDELRQSRWIALWQALSVAPRGANSRGVR